MHPAALWGAGPTHWPESGSARAAAPAQGGSLGAGTGQEHLACRDRPGKKTSLGTFVIPPNLCNETVLLSSNISKEGRKASPLQPWPPFHCGSKSAHTRPRPGGTKAPLRPQPPATATPQACTMTPSRPPDPGAVPEPPASWHQTTLTKRWRRKGELHRGGCPDRAAGTWRDDAESRRPLVTPGVSVLPLTCAPYTCGAGIHGHAVPRCQAGYGVSVRADRRSRPPAGPWPCACVRGARPAGRVPDPWKLAGAWTRRQASGKHKAVL